MSKITLTLFGSDNPEDGYIGWSPVRLTIEGGQSTGNASVILKSRSNNGSIPRVAFMDKIESVPVDEIVVDLSAGKADIYIVGKFQPGKRHNGASEDGKDIVVEAAWADMPGEVKGSLEVMIRVRKDANELSDKARNDFLDALAFLNGIGEYPAAGPGRGIYVTDFVGMHVAGASQSEHGDSHFLPWHRLYLLDLERLLQKVKPAVSLPYWRFDKPAPNVFNEDFMGATGTMPKDSRLGPTLKRAKFSGTNPLSDWMIGNVRGIPRVAYFDTKNEPAPGIPPESPDGPFPLIDEIATLTLGGTNEPEFGTRRSGFSEMEVTPHGAAHVSFNGPINNVPDAPQDPLFFLLHCNVDRLWALWQFVFYRDFVNEKKSYPYQEKLEITAHSTGVISGSFPDYYKLVDTPQWPWDSGLSKPGHIRPPGTRSGNFTRALQGKNLSDRPPTLGDTIDAYGFHNQANDLGTGFDDIPFGHDRPIGQAAKIAPLGSYNPVVIVSDYRKKLADEIQEHERTGEGIDAATRRILEIARDPRQIDSLVRIINDPGSSVDDKVAAINTLNNVSNFSPEVRSRMAEIVNALRGMMRSPDQSLRMSALSTLAWMKDEVAQALLLQEVESDKQEEDKVVPTPMAILLLGRDEKALPAPLLRRIAQNPPTPESREEAVRHMAADRESFDILKEIMEDDKNSLEVRSMIPNMLSSIDAPAFLTTARKQLQAKGANHDLAPFLAKGVAGVRDENAETDVNETKATIRGLMQDAPDTFKSLSNKLLFKDDDSPEE